MAYRYHLRITGSDHPHVYSTFAAAARAIAASLTDETGSWELVRTNDSSDSWTAVLCGAGPPNAGTRFAALRHYPPHR